MSSEEDDSIPAEPAPDVGDDLTHVWVEIGQAPAFTATRLGHKPVPAGAVHIGPVIVSAAAVAWAISVLAHGTVGVVAVWVASDYQANPPSVAAAQGDGASQGGLYQSVGVPQLGLNDLNAGSLGRQEIPAAPTVADTQRVDEALTDIWAGQPTVGAWVASVSESDVDLQPPDAPRPMIGIGSATSIATPRRRSQMPASLLRSVAATPPSGSGHFRGGPDVEVTGRSQSGFGHGGKNTGTQQASPGSGSGEPGDGSGLPGRGSGGTPAGVVGGGLPVPEYPRESRLRGEEGRVVLEIQVLPDGTVGDVRVLEDAGYPRLTNSAIVAVRKAKFMPATSNGKPAESLLRVPFLFSLRQARSR